MTKKKNLTNSSKMQLKRSEAVNIEFMLKNHKENLKKGTMENYQLFDR